MVPVASHAADRPHREHDGGVHALGWLIVAIVILAVVAGLVVVIKRRRRRGGIIATGGKG